MVKLIFIFIFIVAEISSQVLLGDLPPKIIADVIGILTMGVRYLVGNCSNAIAIKNNFLLYNRKTVDEPTLLSSTNVHEIDPHKPIVFIIHGWLASGTTGWPQELKEVYLNTTDLNAVVVDWSPYADVIDYTSACCHVPEVGKQLGDLLCDISTTLGVDLGTVHIVGHSLGAQVAGFTGQQVNSTCGQAIGRITGLDPAGPGYQYVEKWKRLDSGDAKFVDVIHTNEGVAGYYGHIGDVDFFVNCGTLQPGCLTISLTNLHELLKLPVSALVCNHGRSYEYFIESVKSNDFLALSCIGCPLFCAGSSFYETVMGEYCPTYHYVARYVVYTNPMTPYAKG